MQRKKKQQNNLQWRLLSWKKWKVPRAQFNSAYSAMTRTVNSPDEVAGLSQNKPSSVAVHMVEAPTSRQFRGNNTLNLCGLFVVAAHSAVIQYGSTGPA